MAETRKVTVQDVTPGMLEYDREVEVELWHNAYQSSALRLSRVEALALLQQLQAYLEEAVPRGR